MKIKKVEKKKHLYTKSKYSGLCDHIRSMKVNTAIEVTLDSPITTLSSTLGQIFRRGRKQYKILTRKLDLEGKKWYIEKNSREE